MTASRPWNVALTSLQALGSVEVCQSSVDSMSGRKRVTRGTPSL
jgi:hypothetical protein